MLGSSGGGVNCSWGGAVGSAGEASCADATAMDATIGSVLGAGAAVSAGFESAGFSVAAISTGALQYGQRIRSALALISFHVAPHLAQVRSVASIGISHRASFQLMLFVKTPIPFLDLECGELAPLLDFWMRRLPRRVELL